MLAVLAAALLLLPGAAVAVVDTIDVSASPDPVLAGDTIDVTVDVTLSGGTDADWQSTNITLVKPGEVNVELYCGDDPNVTDANGAHQFVFSNLTVPANTPPGDWTVRVRTYDGNGECADGAPSNPDEGEDTTYTLTVITALTLTKSGTGPDDDYTTAGQTLNYTFSVENTGTSPLAGPVTIDDDAATDESCPDVNTVGNLDGFLDPGETIVCTASYTTVAGDVTSGFVTNCATALADGETSNVDCETLGLDLGIQLDLVLCQDGSGSIDPGDWTLQLQGVHAGLDTSLSPDFLNGSVRVTVLVFAGAATLGVGPTIIDSQATLDDFTADVEALAQPGGTTDIAECITLAHSVLCPGNEAAGRGDCPDNGVHRVIDISTDGDPTTENCPDTTDDQLCAIIRSNEAEFDGVNVLNVIGIGPGPTEANMVEWAFPEPVEVFDTDLGEFPEVGDEGFVVLVDDFVDYEPAISAKIVAELSSMFTVIKQYTDANVTPVDVMLTCTGLATVIDPPNPTPAAPGAPAQFQVSGFEPGDTCTAVEVNDTLPPGYTKDESGCVDISIQDPGTCTIVNTLETAQFTVNKNFDPDNPAGSVMVTLTCGGTTSIDSANPTAATEAAPAVFDVSGFGPADTCTATEGTPPLGYTVDESDCQDGLDLADGGSCTIVNTLDTAQFTVNKNFDPDNPAGSVMVTLTCGGTTSIDSANPTAATEAAPAVFDVSGFGPADTCTATEGTPPLGYTVDESDCQDGLDLADGGSCTIVNTLDTAQFTVNKNFDPDNAAGSVMVTLTCGGTTSIDSTNPTAATEAAPAVFDVSGFGPADTCTATEGTPPLGYTVDESDCQDGLDLADGGSCTIVNTLDTAQFTVNKNFDPDNAAGSVMVTLTCGGTTSIDSANPTAATEAAPAVFDVSGFGPADTCTATEGTPPLGYTADESDCQDGQDLADGGSCTIVNTANTGTFTVRKIWADDNQGDVSVTATCTAPAIVLNNPQPAGLSGSAIFNVSRVTESTTCTATEAVPEGYEADLSDCQDGDPIDGGCAITNTPVAEDRATFRVTKDFTDDNPEGVEVLISCNTGLPLDQSKVITESEHVEFVVGDFDPGEMDCDVSEVVPDGYSPTYTAGFDTEGDAVITEDPEGCHFDDVVAGDFTCHIVNTPDPVDVVIIKDWVFEGTSVAQGIDQGYDLTLFCDAEIVNGTEIGGDQEAPSGNGPGCGLFVLQEAPQGFFFADWCKAFSGEGPDTFIAEVIPEWPDSHCFVIERVFDNAVEVDNGCLSIVVSAGNGATCTITNTVFFEGIPTLNQYGLALLALLMLGIGFVGFRRFA